MSRTALFLYCLAPLLAKPYGLYAQSAPPQQPVYIFLTTNVGDHFNWAITEERLKRTLPMVEKYRKDRPEIADTVYLSGAMSDALTERNGDDHLLDFLRGKSSRELSGRATTAPPNRPPTAPWWIFPTQKLRTSAGWPVWIRPGNF